MVTFAPEVAATPSYPFQSDQSRSIQEPKTNTSKEIALKGGASAIGDAVGIAEGYVEGNIKQQLHTGMDQINNDAMDRLTQAKLDTSLIDKNDTPQALPAGLENLDRKFATLDMARKGDKYSQTYIDMQRDTLLKQARADHPGHRDFIDDLNAKYTREDPANKVISSLIGDINSYRTAANEKKNTAQTQIWKGVDAGWNDAPDMLAAYKAGRLGKDPEQAIADWAYKNTKSDYERKKAVDSMAIDKYNNEKYRNGGEEVATIESDRIVRDSLDGAYVQSGIKAMDYPHLVLSGQAERLSDPELEMIGTGIQQRKSMAYQQFIKTMNTPQDKLDGKTISQVVSPTRLNEIWKEQSQRFDDQAAMFKDKNFGMAFEAHNIDEARARGVDHYLANNPNSASVYLFQKALGKEGPGFASEFGKSILSDKDLLDGVRKTFNVDAMKAVTQSPNNPLQPMNKIPFTMKEGLDRVSSTVGAKPEEVASYAKGSLNLVDKISDPKFPDSAKLKLAQYAFDPANAKLLDKFSKEDQANVYQRLYSYGNIKEMYKLGQQDPKVWENFKTAAYNHFGSNLLHTQLMDLNEIAPNKNLSIAWNSEEHQFRVDKWPKATSRYSAQENATIDVDYQKAQKSITAINTGLKSISLIAKSEHRDANVDALQFLISAGVAPGSLPGGMLEAIKNSKRQPHFEDKE